MKVLKTKFKDLLIFKKTTHNDNRGYFRELFKQNKIKKKFIFDYISLSKKNVIRGIHIQLQNPQAKLITVFSGEIFDVVIDCRKKSKTFGKHFSLYMSSKNNTSLYIPEGFAHGFCSLSNNTILHYKCSSYRDKRSEIGIIWNDKNLKINWPTKQPIISQKDRKNYKFLDFLEYKKFKKVRW